MDGIINIERSLAHLAAVTLPTLSWDQVTVETHPCQAVPSRAEPSSVSGNRPLVASQRSKFQQHSARIPPTCAP